MAWAESWKDSLQRSADKVRINVQLIDTRTNAHLWADSYDRKLDDVFAVESEVANTIAEQLDAKLVQRISTKPPTANAAAYNAYLRGVGIEQSQTGFASLQNAPPLTRKPSNLILTLRLPGHD